MRGFFLVETFVLEPTRRRVYLMELITNPVNQLAGCTIGFVFGLEARRENRNIKYLCIYLKNTRIWLFVSIYQHIIQESFTSYSHTVKLVNFLNCHMSNLLYRHVGMQICNESIYSGQVKSLKEDRCTFAR